jgi:hypothetical protein
MYFITLVFVAWNTMSGGFVNVTTTFDTVEKCHIAQHDLETSLNPDGSIYHGFKIITSKCY